MNFKSYKKIIALLTILIPLSLTAQNNINVNNVLSSTVTPFANQPNMAAISVAVYYQGNRYYFNNGVNNLNSKQPVTQNSIFEIASLTKLFTAGLLGICVNQNKCQLQSTLSNYIPALKNAGNLPIGQITLQQLATHTSSLPRSWDAFSLNPNQNNADAILYHRLLSWRPDYPIGSHYTYSNLGFAILGDAVSNAMDSTYSALLQQWIFQPLQMSHSFLSVPSSMQNLLVASLPGQIPQYQIYATLQGGGALFSSSGDLLNYLIAGFGNVSSVLTQSFLTTQQVYFSNQLNFGQGLAWEKRMLNNTVIYTKNGRLTGYSTEMISVPSQKIAIVVLANCQGRKAGNIAYAVLSQLLN